MMLEAKSDKEAHRIRLPAGRRRARQQCAEMGVLLGLYERQLAGYHANQKAALKLLGVGESPRNERLDAAELAAWTMVASAILNLDETITKG